MNFSTISAISYSYCRMNTSNFLPTKNYNLEVNFVCRQMNCLNVYLKFGLNVSIFFIQIICLMATFTKIENLSAEKRDKFINSLENMRIPIVSEALQFIKTLSLFCHFEQVRDEQ